MKITYNINDIEGTERNGFDETVHVLKKTSEYFLKFSGFIRDNTNFLDSHINLMDVKCVCDKWMYDERLDRNVLRYTVDEDGNYDTKSDCLILSIAGGKNGCGVWHEYLEDLAILFGNFSKAGYKAYLVDMSNDCMDDVFYATFCIR